MSGEIRKQGDPRLRAVLDSAALDEPPAGAEDALLAALGLGAAAAVVSAAQLSAAAKAGASQAPLASGASALAKAAPLVAKLLGVLGVAGLGAVAWTQHSPPRRACLCLAAASPTPIGSERSQPAERTLDLTQRAPLPLPVAPAAARSVEPAAHVTAATAPPPHEPAAHGSAAFAPAAVAPTGDSLEVETRLLGAARKSLAAGDKATAREYLRQYEREVTAGSLQREADILWNRAR